ncbi:TatD family hydrolase [Commensalibacter papalotli (ex Servin-Garciduenas et al. 2014)]|uniref:Deoxyribonuclease TatD n=1 Tax=Commensalibacter papalotli (ex Servin-Garciduenas et al. 2014) TaxID=1208583 RepID=W7E0Y8_9PROT|nr:TatD family hydrolase [Commensalibacter papalotli (ex Servin-Garciduenas et al. 2014)]EUK18684.1 deoxyribonuclease TatD [Commensalibacter papalotli (ex Servin-Garciduenas et al. 2014)]
MRLVDSHCHLDFFSDEEIATLLDHAEEAKLGEVVTIGTRISKADVQKRITSFARPDLKLWCTVGTHPEYVKDEVFATADEIAASTDHPQVIGIGETGLDYFYGEPSIFIKQQEFFRAHIQAAQKTQLPVCIHAREADDDIARILQEETKNNGSFPFLIHCFTSSLALAQTAIELGGYISISGIATFKKAQELRDIIVQLPIDRLLVETDSPYLAPVPYRGKRNEPAFVAHTAKYVAELVGMSEPDFVDQTTTNFHHLFTKAK